jgi:NAD(P)-dependent dehydrogenase (short-subunit alcohol dehydrogenase family)
MYTDLKGKTTLVTGSGKKTGIGYAIVRSLAASGANVIISDLGQDRSGDDMIKTGTLGEMESIVREIEEEFSVSAMAVEVDVTDNDAIGRMIEKIRESFEHIDVLCNNAGASFGVPNAVHTYDESAWMKTIDINLHGVFRVTRAVLPMMAGIKGSIINISSRAGKVPPLWNGAYAVSKAGVIMLTKVLALELGSTGIRVNAICPGLIMTDLQSWRIDLEAQVLNSTAEEREKALRDTVPLGWLGEPAEVASLAAYLASDASSYITGQAINVCGGLTMEL